LSNCICCHTKDTCPVETEIQLLRRQIKEEKQSMIEIIELCNSGKIKDAQLKFEEIGKNVKTGE